jgi:hypothetical protein
VLNPLVVTVQTRGAGMTEGAHDMTHAIGKDQP